MPQKIEQLDFIKKFDDKKPRKKIFGDEQDVERLLNQTPDAGEESEKGLNTGKLIHPRHNRPPYPQGVDGNPIISKKYEN